MSKTMHPTEILRTMTLAQRLSLPSAVMTNDGERTGLVQFDNPRDAEAFATSCEDEGITVTRWAALAEHEYKTHTPTPGWRQVTYFI